MSRYIDALEIRYIHRPQTKDDIAYKDEIDKIPTADVAPVVHAHWVKSELSRDRNVYICSRCARTVSTPLGVSFDVVLDENPYCHCGAKMDEEVKEDA